MKTNNPRPSRRRAPRASRATRSPEPPAPAARPEEISKPAPEVSAPPIDLPAPPEAAFAVRVPPPPPPRPRPATRRAIFFDVENTSRPDHVARVIEHLRLDRLDRQTDLVAVGNWRVASAECARLLARNGAQLVHSAPSTGVRDWSDLRIAVSAGVWLAGARPGDVIEIVSDDRAFDAVGDVAATLGVGYRRLSFRSLPGLRAEEALETHEDAEPRGRRRRRGQRGRGRHERVARAGTPREQHEPIHHAPQTTHHGTAQPHTAPHDEIVSLTRELIQTSGRGSITMDTLANALKTRGFRRPPGSPRLITRLRRIRELEVSRNGVITLAAGATPGVPVEPEALAEAPDAAPVDLQPAEPPAGDAAPARRSRRRGRRGGRRHRRRAPEAAAAE